MDRVRRFAMTLLEKYPDYFSTNFEENKKRLEKIAIIRSKQLRNEIAGYITSYLRKVVEEEKKKPAEIVVAEPG